MSDTPETDAAVVGSNGQWSFVLKETAQKLERERNQARYEIENLKASDIHTCHDKCSKPMCILRRERDNALAKIESIRNIFELKTEKPLSKKATKPTKRKK